MAHDPIANGDASSETTPTESLSVIGMRAFQARQAARAAEKAAIEARSAAKAAMQHALNAQHEAKATRAEVVKLKAVVWSVPWFLGIGLIMLGMVLAKVW